MKTLLRILISVALLAVLIVAIDYRTIPSANTAQFHFDTLLVLGCPAKLDGTPTPEQRERVLEGVREYKTGIAPHLIMTGGAAHNQFTEAHMMAQFAETQGVPASAIIEEDQAKNTVQNIYYSAEIMHQQNWHSAAIVSSPSHLPRTALIMQTFDSVQPSLAFDWQTHAAHWPPEFGLGHKLALYSGEAWFCLKLRVKGFPSSKFLPS